MVTEITIVAPASTGLGVMVAAVIWGTEVSRVTVRVTEEVLPAASVAVTLMTLEPLARVTDLDHAPPVPTVTAPWSTPLSSILMVTGSWWRRW